MFPKELFDLWGPKVILDKLIFLLRSPEPRNGAVG